eukprot:snap_masked-scaffold225_size250570-processed-gene-1.5 protein:Tk01783 transcript:snap_masked-scaffold225_size250570-processed-gene-1.5-mRNA-1 annotation:"---NA---"
MWVLQERLTSIENENYEEAFNKFKSVEANATRGFNLSQSDENRLVCTRIKIFSQVMVLTFDHKERTFLPFEVCTQKKKREVGSAIQSSVDFMTDSLTGVEFTFCDHFSAKTKQRKLKSHRDDLDKVLAVAYPYISSGLGLSNPNQLVDTSSDVFVVSLLPPKYIPEGMDDASHLQVGTSKDDPHHIVSAKVFYGVDKASTQDKTKDPKFNIHFLNKTFDANEMSEKPIVVRMERKVLTVVEDLNGTDNSQRSILHIAAKQVVSPHLPYAANTLVDNGLAMWNKFPALREASTKRMASNIDHGSNLTRTSKSGKTASHYALENRHYQVLDTLVKRGAPPPPEHLGPTYSFPEYSSPPPPLPPRSRSYPKLPDVDRERPKPSAPPLDKPKANRDPLPVPPRRKVTPIRAPRPEFEEMEFVNSNPHPDPPTHTLRPTAPSLEILPRLIPRRDPPPIPPDEELFLALPPRNKSPPMIFETEPVKRRARSGGNRLQRVGLMENPSDSEAEISERPGPALLVKPAYKHAIDETTVELNHLFQLRRQRKIDQ